MKTRRGDHAQRLHHQCSLLGYGLDLVEREVADSTINGPGGEFERCRIAGVGRSSAAAKVPAAIPCLRPIDEEMGSREHSRTFRRAARATHPLSAD